MNIDININGLIRTDVIKISNFIYEGIRFSSNFQTKKMDIFNKLFKDNGIDKKELHEFEVKDKIIQMKNLILPKNISLRNFLYMVAFCCDVDVTSISFETGNIPNFSNLQTNDYLDNYVLGNSELSLKINSKKQIPDLGYETIFNEQYMNSIYYFSSLNFWKTTIYPTIEVISVICVKKDMRINITKLFNINSISNTVQKILIHSSKLDDFMGNYRKMQYVKCPIYIQNGFTNAVSNYETVTFYVNMWNSETVKLNRIECSENGVVVFRFGVNDTSEYHQNITADLQTFIDKGFYKTMLENIQFEEAIYSETIPEFDNVKIGDITSSVVIQGIDGSNFENISKTINQDIPYLKYKTNSSISIGFFTEASFTSSILYFQALNSHEYITKQIVQKFIMGTLHLLTNPNNLIFTLYNIDSMDEFKWLFELVCGIFPAPTIKQYNYRADKSIAAIKNKYQNIPSKKLLRSLYESDNIIFGSRKIGDAYRPYSSLAQKDRQRVALVSKEEYKVLEKEQPESCATVQSQQNQNERLFLFCPFDDYRFLNFRYLTNQVCFPKCTNALTNRTQYKYCSEQLQIDTSSKMENRFENKTLTLYNALLSFGRKCKAPEELTSLLINYYLYKPKLTCSVTQYCLSMFKLEPFIIKRDIRKETYTILTDYSSMFDYILVLQSEADDNYFICLSNIDNKPFRFSENTEFKRFIDSITDNMRIRHYFVNFMNNLLKLKLDPEEPIQKTLKDLTIKHQIVFVTDGKVIKGIVKNNIFYTTPPLMINHSKRIYTIANYKIVIMSVLNGFIKLPELEDIPLEYVSKFLIDFHTNSVRGLIWMNEELYIEPYKDYQFLIDSSFTKKQIPLRIEYFDFNATLIFKISDNNQKIFNTFKLKDVEISRIFDIWLFIFCSTFKELDLMKFKEYVKNNIEFSSSIRLKYLSNSYYVSWRNTVVTEDDLNKYIEHIQESNQDDLLYCFSDIISEDMVFKFDHFMESIQVKIITGGAA